MLFFSLVGNGSSESAPESVVRVLALAGLLAGEGKDSGKRVTKRGRRLLLGLFVVSVDNVTAATAANRVAGRLDIHGLLDLLEVLVGGHGVHLGNGQLVAVATAAGSKGLVGGSKVLDRGWRRGHASQGLELRRVWHILGGSLGRGHVVAESATSSENHCV